MLYSYSDWMSPSTRCVYIKPRLIGSVKNLPAAWTLFIIVIWFDKFYHRVSSAGRLQLIFIVSISFPLPVGDSVLFLFYVVTFPVSLQRVSPSYLLTVSFRSRFVFVCPNAVLSCSGAFLVCCTGLCQCKIGLSICRIGLSWYCY